MNVEAYTYDADVHCTSCATARFGKDGNGWVPQGAEDSEGNPVHAVFDGQCAEADWTHCGTCGEEL